MDRLWPVLMMVGVIVANVPALREQWRTDRAGSIKTVELFLVYLVYCLIGGGLIIWLASRAHETQCRLLEGRGADGRQSWVGFSMAR